MKKILILILMIFSIFNASAQVDEILDQSKKHNNISSNRGGSDSNIDGDVCMEPCADAACQFCAEIGIQIFGALLLEHHDYIMKNIDVNPLPMSFEIRPNIGYNFNNQSLHILPSIRGNLGIYSTDVRYFMIAEYDAYGVNSYSVWEWQLAILNLIPSEYLAFHIGSGLFYETSSGKLSNEHYLAMDINTKDQAIINRIESRFAMNYDQAPNSLMAMTEVNYMTGLRLFKNDVVYIYWFAGLHYQQFYETVSSYTIQTGMVFNTH